MKLGKTPARANSISFRLRDYLSLATLPTPPTKFGHQSLINSNAWGMLGNDTVGDCVIAGAGHETMLWNREANKLVNISTANAISDYSAITGYNPKDPNTDQGTDMQVAASYRRKTGMLDANNARHKVAAYLAITPGNKLEVKQAVYVFSAVGIGIQFPASAMDQFNAGKAWTVVYGSKIEGGHYIPAVGYDAKYVYVVTWGKLQPMSWQFFEKYCDEGVAYVSDEMLTNGKSLEGFSATQLASDLSELK